MGDIYLNPVEWDHGSTQWHTSGGDGKPACAVLQRNAVVDGQYAYVTLTNGSSTTLWMRFSPGPDYEGAPGSGDILVTMKLRRIDVPSTPDCTVYLYEGMSEDGGLVLRSTIGSGLPGSLKWRTNAEGGTADSQFGITSSAFTYYYNVWVCVQFQATSDCTIAFRAIYANYTHSLSESHDKEKVKVHRVGVKARYPFSLTRSALLPCFDGGMSGDWKAYPVENEARYSCINDADADVDGWPDIWAPELDIPTRFVYLDNPDVGNYIDFRLIPGSDPNNAWGHTLGIITYDFTTADDEYLEYTYSLWQGNPATGGIKLVEISDYAYFEHSLFDNYYELGEYEAKKITDYGNLWIRVYVTVDQPSPHRIVIAHAGLRYPGVPDVISPDVGFREAYQIMSAEIHEEKGAAIFEVGKANLFRTKLPRNRWIDFRCEHIFRSEGYCHYGCDEFGGTSQVDLNLGGYGYKSQGWYFQSGVSTYVADINITYSDNLALQVASETTCQWNSNTGSHGPILYKYFNPSVFTDDGGTGDFDIWIKLGGYPDTNLANGLSYGIVISEDNNDPNYFFYMCRINVVGAWYTKVFAVAGASSSDIVSVPDVGALYSYFRIVKVGPIFYFYRATTSSDWGAAWSATQSNLHGVALRIGLAIENRGTASAPPLFYFDTFYLSSGGYVTCDKTITDCRVRDNIRRFGGAPGIIHGRLEL